MAKFLAFICWASVIIEAWLIVIGILPSNALSWVFFGLFLLVAIMASAVASPKKDK